MKTKEQLAADAIRKVVKDLNQAIHHGDTLGLRTQIDVVEATVISGHVTPVLKATVSKEV